MEMGKNIGGICMLRFVLILMVALVVLCYANDDMETRLVTFETNYGDIELELYPEVAPNLVANFVKLAEDGFYDGIYFHRVIPDFMIQGGCPNTKDGDRQNDGTGGPGYKLDDEFNEKSLQNKYGHLSMANSGPNTNGSQFFIITKEEGTPWLDGRHTVLGKVINGMDVVHKIENLPRDKRDNPLKEHQATIEKAIVIK